MTAWYSGASWNWCGLFTNVPALLVLWGAVFTATVVAVRVASRQRSDLLAPVDTGSHRAEGAVAARIA